MENAQDKAANAKEKPKHPFPVVRQRKFWLSGNSRSLQHPNK
jgi:hypothetical protein